MDKTSAHAGSIGQDSDLLGSTMQESSPVRGPEAVFVAFLGPFWMVDLSIVVSWMYLFAPFVLLGAAATWVFVTGREKRRRERIGASLEAEMQARQEAEEALYSMAHDLKTPLVTLDHLMEDIDGSHKRCGEDVHEATEGTRLVLQHMGGLVDQMLSFARCAADGPSVGRVRVDEAVDDVVDMLRSKCDERQVRLVIEGGPDDRLHVAPEALRHILLNLMDNAVKYGSDEAPLVRISWGSSSRADQEDAFVLEVADNGEGVRTEHRDQVFRLLKRFPDRRGRDLPGSGVGLAVVRRIVDQQGARVEIDDAPEGGALFRLVYPGGLWSRSETAPASSDPSASVSSKRDREPPLRAARRRKRPARAVRGDLVPAGQQ